MVSMKHMWEKRNIKWEVWEIMFLNPLCPHFIDLMDKQPSKALLPTVKPSMGVRGCFIDDSIPQSTFDILVPKSVNQRVE